MSRDDLNTIKPVDAEFAPRTVDVCPYCGSNHFKVWTVRTPVMRHWVLNPGLAFNELVLGQRMPCEILFCRECLSTLVRCPDCGLQTERIAGLGLFHWFGLVCPDCGGRIPCVLNVTARVILMLTLPLWWYPAKRLEPLYLAFEQEQAIKFRARHERVTGKKRKVRRHREDLWDRELDG